MTDINLKNPANKQDFLIRPATLSVFWKFRSLDGDLNGKPLLLPIHPQEKI
jgi:hypothetical protein